MQLITLAAFIGSALAIAAPEGLLAPRAPALCSKVNSCVTTNGNPASATAFCSSYNSVGTVTSGTAYETATPTDCSSDAKRFVGPVVDVLAPQKPRCFKKYLDGHLSKACSCLSIAPMTVPATTETVIGSCPEPTK